MKIIEQFDSIQGEGTQTGVPMTFIRLAGCNLRCKWCDTAYSQNPKEETFFNKTAEHFTALQEWICITGGEPLLQQDELAGLLFHLKGNAHQIEIETNGSIIPPEWAFADIVFPGNPPTPFVDSWVVDIKLPSSGNPSKDAVIVKWAAQMKEADQIKFVVGDRDDLTKVGAWLKVIGSTAASISISPVMPSPQSWLQEVAEFAVRNHLRFGLQIHKIVWDPNERGV